MRLTHVLGNLPQNPQVNFWFAIEDASSVAFIGTFAAGDAALFLRAPLARNIPVHPSYILKRQEFVSLVTSRPRSWGILPPKESDESETQNLESTINTI